MRRVNIEIVGLEGTGLMPELVSLWRTELRDQGLRHYYVRFFANEAHVWRHGREMGRRDGYPINYRSRVRPTDFGRAWGYIFDFADGTRGACEVRHVHLALAALGARIDMDSEPSDERR
jgi:hypothetical protein